MDSATLMITVLTCLVGVGVTILLAAVPWAYVVHGRLSAIEAQLGMKLNRMEDQEKQLDRMEEVVNKHETRIQILEGRRRADS